MDRKFRVNDPVWAKMRGYPPWPAKVTKHPKGVHGPSNRLYVFFYGTHQNAWMLPSDLYPYAEYKDTYLKPSSKKGYAEAVWEIEEDPQLTITSSVKTPKRKGPAKKICKSSSPVPLEKPRKRKTHASPHTSMPTHSTKPHTPHTCTPTPSAMKKECLDSELELETVLSSEAPLPTKQVMLDPSSQLSEDGSQMQQHRYSTRRKNVTAGIVEDLKQNYMARKEQRTFTTKATPPSAREISPPVPAVVETTPKGKAPTPPPKKPKYMTRKEQRTSTTKATPPSARREISPPVTPKGKTPTPPPPTPPKKKTLPSKQDKANKQPTKKTTKPANTTRVTRRSQRFVSNETSSNDNTTITIKPEPVISSQECEQSSQEISSQDTTMDCSEQTDTSIPPVIKPSKEIAFVNETVTVDCNEQTNVSSTPPVVKSSQEIASQDMDCSEQIDTSTPPVIKPSQEITSVNKTVDCNVTNMSSTPPVIKPSHEITSQDMDCNERTSTPPVKPTTASKASSECISSRTRRSRHPQQQQKTNTQKKSRKKENITELKSTTDKDIIVTRTMLCDSVPNDVPEISTEVTVLDKSNEKSLLSDILVNTDNNLSTGSTEHITVVTSMITTDEDSANITDNGKDNHSNKATEDEKSTPQSQDDLTVTTSVPDNMCKPSIETEVMDIASAEVSTKENELPSENLPDLTAPSSDNISHVKDNLKDCDENTVKSQSSKEAGKNNKTSPKPQRPKRRIKNATVSAESPLKKFKVSGPPKNLNDKGSSNEKAKDDQRSKLRIRQPSGSGKGLSQEKVQTDSTRDVSVEADNDKKADTIEGRESDDGNKEQEEDSVPVSAVPSLPPFIAPQSGMTSMQILQTYNYNLKAALTIEAPNTEYAIEMLNKLSNFYCTAADLDKFPSIMDTVKKLKRYRACPGVMEGAEKVHEKFKKLFLHPPPPRPAQRIKSASRIPKKAPIMADYIRAQSSLASNSRSTLHGNGITDVITKHKPSPRQLRTLHTPTVPDKPVEPQEEKETENTVEVPSTVDAHTEGGAPNIYNSVVSAQPLPSNDKNDQTVPILED